MTYRDPDDSVDDRWQTSSQNRARRPSSRGPHIGPLQLTPTRVTLAIALIGSLGFLLYAVTVRDPSQIPMLSAGAAVLAIVFAALALAGAIGTYRAAADGYGGRAFMLAVLGGIAGVISFACFSGAVILALVARP